MAKNQRTRTGPAGLPLDLSVYPALAAGIHRPDASVVPGQPNSAYPGSHESNGVSSQSLSVRATLNASETPSRTSPAGRPISS